MTEQSGGESSRLAGRAALITGASQGLGQAIARRFVAEGASVLLVARGETLLASTAASLERTRRLPSQRIAWTAADISQPADVARSVAEAHSRLGDVDILVNNAGILGPIGPLESVDWDEWVSTLQVNLIGTAAMCRAVIPSMKARGRGKIINLSGGGATAPRPRFTAYAASKAAIVRLTETLAHELAEHHIDVNAIAPGALNTRMLDQTLQAGEEKVGEVSYRQSLQQQEKGGDSLDRAAELAVFLASRESDGITGRLISAVWDPWLQLQEHRDQLKDSDVFTLRRITPADRGWDLDLDR